MEKNRVKSSDINELKGRKKALRQDMDEIQSEIESSLNEVREGMLDRIRIRYWVDKYPLQLFGSALIAGYVFARKTGSRKKSGSPTSGPSSRGVFTGLLIDELKKLITQRTVRYLMSRIEHAIDERKESNL